MLTPLEGSTAAGANASSTECIHYVANGHDFHLMLTGSERNRLQELIELLQTAGTGVRHCRGINRYQEGMVRKGQFANPA